MLEIEILNTECNRCCYIQCGEHSNKEKQCHCDNKEGHNCYNCKHKDVCF